eukprot:gene28258-35090_t
MERELYGSAAIPLLFWSCANDVIRADQTKRFYPLLAIIGNLGPILAGLTTSYLKHIYPTLKIDTLNTDGTSFKLLSRDSYLLNIATIVLSYGMTIEFTEILWKSLIKQALPSQSDYHSFQGRVSTLTGISSFVMMLIGSRIITSLGWQAGALTTPLVMLLTSAPFFAWIVLRDSVLR